MELFPTFRHFLVYLLGSLAVWCIVYLHYRISKPKYNRIIPVCPNGLLKYTHEDVTVMLGEYFTDGDYGVTENTTLLDSFRVLAEIINENLSKTNGPEFRIELSEHGMKFAYKGHKEYDVLTLGQLKYLTLGEVIPLFAKYMMTTNLVSFINLYDKICTVKRSKIIPRHLARTNIYLIGEGYSNDSGIQNDYISYYDYEQLCSLIDSEPRKYRLRTMNLNILLLLPNKIGVSMLQHLTRLTEAVNNVVILDGIYNIANLLCKAENNILVIYDQIEHEECKTQLLNEILKKLVPLRQTQIRNLQTKIDKLFCTIDNLFTNFMDFISGSKFANRNIIKTKFVDRIKKNNENIQIAIGRIVSFIKIILPEGSTYVNVYAAQAEKQELNFTESLDACLEQTKVTNSSDEKLKTSNEHALNCHNIIKLEDTSKCDDCFDNKCQIHLQKVDIKRDTTSETLLKEEFLYDPNMTSILFFWSHANRYIF